MRFRPLMIPSMVEKFGYGITVVVLGLQSRVHSSDLVFAGTDLLLDVLFVVAYLLTPARGTQASWTSLHHWHWELRQIPGCSSWGIPLGTKLSPALNPKLPQVMVQMLIHQRRPFHRSQRPEKKVRMLRAYPRPTRRKAVNEFAQPLPLHPEVPFILHH